MLCSENATLISYAKLCICDRDISPVCAVTGISYLIEGVIWQWLPIFANWKPLFAGNGNALHRRVNAVGKKAYECGAVN